MKLLDFLGTRMFLSRAPAPLGIDPPLELTTPSRCFEVDRDLLEMGQRSENQTPSTRGLLIMAA